MRARIAMLCVAAIVVGLGFGALARAGEPIFVNWLVADDPGDQTINDYWERAERGELSVPGLVDLGTMLFYRGFPGDALEMFDRALDIDKDFYEAWFRIGLVEHSEGDLSNAEQAYQKCLKRRPAHGWCNFYLGLLEEQLGHTPDAMKHYEQAFASDPALANPKVNPEVLSSRLALGAQLRHYDQVRFEQALPFRYLEPRQVRKVREQYEPTPIPPPPETVEAEERGEQEQVAGTTVSRAPTATPVATAPPPRPAPPSRRVVPQRQPTSPTPKPSEGGEAPYGAPQIANTSGEAHMIPRWSGSWEIAQVLV